MDHELQLKRVYEPYEIEDVYRILVVRLAIMAVKITSDPERLQADSSRTEVHYLLFSIMTMYARISIKNYFGEQANLNLIASYIDK